MLQFSEDGTGQEALDQGGSEPSGGQDGLGGDGEGQGEGQSFDQGDPSDGSGGQETRGAADGEPQNRKERRAAWKRERDGRERERIAREQVERELAETRRQLKELTGSVSEMSRLQRESLPKPPDPRVQRLEQTRKDLVDALSRLDPKDPGSFQKWRDLEEQLVDIRAEIKVAEAKEELRRELADGRPSERPAWLRPILSEHAWIEEDPDNEELVKVAAKRIAKVKGRDLSNPAVLAATVREAAAQVAAQHGFGKAKADPNARDRVAGASGKGGGAGSGGTGMPTPNQAMISAALTMFPHEGSVEASLKKFWASVGPDVIGALKK